MADKKPSAEWTGVMTVRIGTAELPLDCRLVSVKGKPTPLPLRQVHTNCDTAIKEDGGAEKFTEEQEDIEEGAVELRTQPYCPKCNRALQSDEITKAIETNVGLIQVTEADAGLLNFLPTKSVSVELITANDPAIETIGIDRSFFVFPKPAARDTYAKTFFVLQESGVIGFIPTIVIKRKPRVAILRPMVYPQIIFGSERKCLLLDLLNDSGKLKDPARFADYPGEFSKPLTDLTTIVVEARKIAGRLDPERCIDPKRQRAAEIAKRVVARSVGRS